MVATRKSPDQVRADIVTAAIEVIGRVGIDGLTHRAVAAQANVSLSSTTYHYASRDDIIAAALQRVVDAERREIREGAQRVEADIHRDPSIAHAALRALTQNVISSDFTGPTYLRAQYELQLYAVNQPAMREAVHAWQKDIELQVGRLLSLLGAKEPEAAATILVAAVDGLRLAALTTGQSAHEVDVTIGAAISWFTDAILREQA